MQERPFDLLMACHARIRRYCGGLEALCEVEPGDPREAATAQACQRYFQDALHLHGADEDNSVAPRLGPHLSPGQRELAATLRAQHLEIDARTPMVLSVLEELSVHPPAARRAVFAPFWGLLLSHIDQEERHMFPALNALSESEQAEIVAEIRARRRT